MSEGAEGERFLAAFNALKASVADDPKKLEDGWQDSDPLQLLCDELAGLVRRFELAEEWSPLAFTAPVSIAGARERRDYEQRWQHAVSFVANRDFRASIAEMLKDLGLDEDADVFDASTAHDQLGVQIAEWKDDAHEWATHIERPFDEADYRYQMDQSGDWDWSIESAEAWRRLKICGLDAEGALWRRRALPHVLVPAHVAQHYGSEVKSLYRRLDQAGKAFIFGAPLAALALQRAVIEEVLSKHWGAGKGWVRDANLPHLAWELRAERLKRLANDALHGDPEKLSADKLDRSIIENFVLLRLLIENAPENPLGNSRTQP